MWAVRNRVQFLMVLWLCGMVLLSLPSALFRNLKNLSGIHVVMPALRAAQADLEQGQINIAAIDQMESVIEAPQVAQWLLNMSAVFWKQGRPSMTEALLDEINRRGLRPSLTPSAAYQAAFLLTDLTLAQPDWSLADRLRRLNKALIFAPDYADALALKGMSLAALGQRESGENLLQQALAITFQQANEGLIHIGRYYLRDDSNPAEAGEAWIWMRVGQYYLYYDSNPKKAEEALLISLAMHPDNEWAQNMLAVLLLRQGRCAEALPHAQAAVAIYPEYLGFQRTLGDVYWCVGEEDQAVVIYRQIVIRDPAYYDALQERLSSTGR
jgi:tetratricopeptide (TPR) repeat protein